MTRRSPLRRRTPLRRGTKPIARRTRPRRVSPKKARDDRTYSVRRKAYLLEHPLCQATIAESNLDEAELIRAYRANEFAGASSSFARGAFDFPLSTQIHHRNKKHGRRRNDERFWMAIGDEMHRKIEDHKDWARGRGLLLPINADPDGRAGGLQFATTPELLAIRFMEGSGPPPSF